MKQKDLIYMFIQKQTSIKKIKIKFEHNVTLGVTASDIKNTFFIIRNNASTLLNLLFKEDKLIKIATRPVNFLCKSNLKDIDLKGKKVFSLIEINQILKAHFSTPSNINMDPFNILIGSKNSLLNQINQAKAAIMYPPNGLHTLILGESGVGKTTFANAMYNYYKQSKINKGNSDSFPFISFNCSDYFNNPQLLLSQLFGHTKGAFTGADAPKEGLVEKANGGILFLDEIHRLPPDGQEMLFYLMDKGEYHRLGETDTTRKSNILIIAATTENPNNSLLTTFLRRIPVVINLPSFRDKDIGERMEIIESLFYYEAMNLNLSIKITPKVLKTLTLFHFKNGNIGQLSSEIKLLCAKSFLSHIQSNKKYLKINFEILNQEIKKFSFNNLPITNKNKSFLDMFTEDVTIYPYKNENLALNLLCSHSNLTIYEMISKKSSELKSKGLSEDEINVEINEIIDQYFSSLINKFESNNLNLRQLYEIVDKDIINISVKIINMASKDLNTTFENKFILGLSMHIQALLKRLSDGKPIVNNDLYSIRKKYINEFKLSSKIVKLLNSQFHVDIPEEEKGFLTILFAKNKLKKFKENNVGILVLCHGDSTASSMASVANNLLNSTLVQAIDMPLDTEIDLIYNKALEYAISMDKGNGLLFLVDMGSLENFGEKIMNKTGIKIKTLNSVSTLMVLDALRKVLYKNDSLESIYNYFIETKDYKNKVNRITNKSKDNIIITLCATGQGSSLIAKNILSDMLKKIYINNTIKIIPINYMDYENKIENLQNKFNILACVGSLKPNSDIPYFPINQLLNSDFQQKFIKFIETSINKNNILNKDTKSYDNPYEISIKMLEQYVKYINPRFAVNYIKNFFENLNLNNKSVDDNKLLDLIIHTGCMLDRCIHKDLVIFENKDIFISKNNQLFLNKK